MGGPEKGEERSGQPARGGGSENTEGERQKRRRGREDGVRKP